MRSADPCGRPQSPSCSRREHDEGPEHRVTSAAFGRGAPRAPARGAADVPYAAALRRTARQIYFLLGELRAATTEVERAVIQEWIDTARAERNRAEDALS